MRLRAREKRGACMSRSLNFTRASGRECWVGPMRLSVSAFIGIVERTAPLPSPVRRSDRTRR
eukprot:scaffold161933_cov36-Tisochrysis_lutea.AAC.2